MKRRVFLFGLDGASWNVLDRMIESGQMPNLQRLCDEGVRATLESTRPAITPVAWSSLMAGVNPGKHGIFGFMKKTEKEGFQALMSNRMLIRVPTIFDYYSESGRLISLNLPMSYPATEINGLMVTGMMTPLRSLGDFEYPSGLLKRFSDNGIDYVIDPRMDEPEDIEAGDMFEGWFASGSEFVKKLSTIADNRMKATHLLLEQESWDVFICVIVGTDRLQHLHWDKILPDDGSDPDPIVAQYYHGIDNHIGKLIDKLDSEDSLLIVSDHGFAKLQGEFMTNEWLRRQGWIAQRQARRSLRYSLKLFLNKMGITRAKLSRFIGTQKIGKLQEVASHIDWANSTAYLSGPFGIRINLKGRQAWGKIPPEQYEKTCEAIITALKQLRDDKGQPVLQNVYKASELYKGDAVSEAPDIVLTFREDNNYTAYAGEIGGDLFQPARGKSGDHRIDGIFRVGHVEVRLRPQTDHLLLGIEQQLGTSGVGAGLARNDKEQEGEADPSHGGAILALAAMGSKP